MAVYEVIMICIGIKVSMSVVFDQMLDKVLNAWSVLNMSIQYGSRQYGKDAFF